MPQSSSILKNLLLSSVIATSMIAPSTATADTVNVMVVNMRSADGVYRPALRVVRGGNVTFFRTDDTEAENPLTVSVIRNQARLMAWLMEAIPQTANETFDINIEVIQSTPSEQPAAPTPPVAEPTPPASEPTSTETTTPTPEKEAKQPDTSYPGTGYTGTGYTGTGYTGTGYNGTGYNGTGYTGTGYPSGTLTGPGAPSGPAGSGGMPPANIGCINPFGCLNVISMDSSAQDSVQFAQASIADLDEAGRLAIYPTV